ncbi:MAG: hypothetical protein HKO59_11220 [Phycisphaerales bacterium]|nr:hypothetical protein [Phycisphaerales bacterium]
MQFFPYDLDRRWSPLFTLLRVSESDGVEVTDDGTFRATYGRVSVETPIDNIDHTLITGPHRWYTAVGLRLSFSDDGLTFGTNHRRGLCVAFAEPVPKVIGFKNHSALWASVADPEGLAAAIGR